jgi:hypothetical protein
MEKKSEVLPSLPLDVERLKSLDVADTVLVETPGDWVNDIKQWCLTGSREAVSPSNSAPLFGQSFPGSGVNTGSKGKGP